MSSRRRNLKEKKKQELEKENEEKALAEHIVEDSAPKEEPTSVSEVIESFNMKD